MAELLGVPEPHIAIPRTGAQLALARHDRRDAVRVALKQLEEAQVVPVPDPDGAVVRTAAYEAGSQLQQTNSGAHLVNMTSPRTTTPLTAPRWTPAIFPTLRASGSFHNRTS